MFKQLSNFFNTWKYESAIFIFLMVAGLSIIQSIFYVASWPFSFYLLSYDLGSGSRLLIGSIFNFIFNGFLPYEQIGLIVFCFTTLLCFLVSLFLGKLLKLSEKSSNNIGIIYLILLYLASPVKISTYFSGALMGYLEIYVFAIVLLIIYLFLNSKQNWLFWVITSILCLICMAIHQVFMFILFPIILALMIYNLYENKWKKNLLIGTIFVCCVVGISFLYFQFFSSINVPNVDDLVAILLKKTDLSYSVEYLKLPLVCEYFAPLKQKFFGTMIYASKNLFNPIVLFFTCIFFSPLFLIFRNIWKNIINNSVEKSGKVVFISMQACSLFFVPSFALTCDWGRWFIWLVTFEFALLFILYWKQCKPVVDAIDCFGVFVRDNKFIMGLLLLFFMIFQISLFNIINGFGFLYSL